MMDQMYKFNLNLDQIQNYNHGQQNQNQHLPIHLPIHILTMMMEVHITRKKSQNIFQKHQMIY